jgi:spermidine synthase
MLAAPFFNNSATDPPVSSLAVIGLAAGSIPKIYTRVFGPIHVDGIELDPEIVEVGRRYFALNEPNINIIIGDGRYELNRLNHRYDVITLDAYKVPYIPWHLTTHEFFVELKDHLTDSGIVAVNVGRGPNDRRLVEAITATLMPVFPTIHSVDVPGTLNTILYATVRPTSANDLSVNIRRLDPVRDPLLRSVLEEASDNLVPSIASDVVFTDQRAPVETIADSIVIRFLLEQGPSGLSGIGN